MVNFKLFCLGFSYSISIVHITMYHMSIFQVAMRLTMMRLDSIRCSFMLTRCSWQYHWINVYSYQPTCIKEGFNEYKCCLFIFAFNVNEKKAMYIFIKVIRHVVLSRNYPNISRCCLIPIWGSHVWPNFKQFILGVFLDLV